jgi:hypothetical protein
VRWLHALFVRFRPHHGAPLTCNRHMQTEIDQRSTILCPVLHVLTSDSDIGPGRIVPAFTWITGLRSCRPFCILLSKTSLKTHIIIPEKHRYPEGPFSCSNCDCAGLTASYDELEKTHNWRSKKQVKQPEICFLMCFLRPELIILPQGG